VKVPIPILFTIPNFITAGSGRALLNVVERLDRAVFLPSVCVRRYGGSIERELEARGIPLLERPFTVPARPYHSLLPRAWAVARPFREQRFALWHSFNYSDDYTEPIIARLAGASAWVYTKKNMMWGGRAWVVRSRLADRIVVLNSAMADRFFAAPRLRRRIHHQPMGIDTARFSPGPPDAVLRRSWGFPEKSFVVAHVADLLPVKDQPFLLRCLGRSDPRIVVVFAGAPLDAAYVEEVRGLSERLGVASRVRFLGRVSDVMAVLRSADAFAFCSRMEGLPVAMIEAMACGLPSVSTDIDAVRDIHLPGYTGLVVPSGDESAFATALDRIAHDPELRRAMGERARQHALERFDIDVEVRGLTGLYRDVLMRKGIPVPNIAPGAGIAHSSRLSST
jgi:glycosyltransferase involved in cell wall biosynthesis